jgi:archaetidylinositol phosphate synthase
MRLARGDWGPVRIEVAMSRRIHRGALHALEQPLICYLTPRIPNDVAPDQLSALSLCGAIVAGASLILCRASPWFLLLLTLGLLANWLGDSFDGAVARYRRRQRPRAGFLIDRGGDILSFSIMIVGLGLSPYLNLPIALMVLVAYLVHAIYGLMKQIVDGVQYVGLGGIGATEIRLLIGLWAGVCALTGMDFSTRDAAAVTLGQVISGALLLAALLLFARRIASDVARLSELDAHPGFSASARYANLRVVRLGGAANQEAGAARETGKDNNSVAPVS